MMENDGNMLTFISSLDKSCGNVFAGFNSAAAEGRGLQNWDASYSVLAASGHKMATAAGDKLKMKHVHKNTNCDMLQKRENP
jgi:hypothetical protein